MAKKNETGKGNIIQGLFLIKSEINIDVLDAQARMIHIVPREKYAEMEKIFKDLSSNIAEHFPNHDYNI